MLRIEIDLLNVYMKCYDISYKVTWHNIWHHHYVEETLINLK